MNIFKIIICFCLLYFFQFSVAQGKTEQLNIYCWAEEIPYSIINDFSKEYGLNVSLTTYDNNETMYSKLKILRQNSGYDLICPSNYYVKKMINENLIQQIDKEKIPNLKNIDQNVLNKYFDPKNQYTLPYTITQTGILYNSKYVTTKIYSWNDLFNTKYKNNILLINDIREVFSIGLILLGYNANDKEEVHIKQVYEKLKTLLPNVKILSAESIKIPYKNDKAGD